MNITKPVCHKYLWIRKEMHKVRNLVREQRGIDFEVWSWFIRVYQVYRTTGWHHNRLGLNSWSWIGRSMHRCNAQAHSEKSCNLNCDTSIGICHWCAIIHCDAVTYLIRTWWEVCCDCACYYIDFTVWWIWTGTVCWGLCTSDTHIRTEKPRNRLVLFRVMTVCYSHRSFVTSLLITSGRVVFLFLLPLSCSLGWPCRQQKAVLSEVKLFFQGSVW